MNRIFSLDIMSMFTKQMRQSFAPGQKRRPGRLPVIPVDGKRTRRVTRLGLKDQLQRHVNDVKAIEVSWVIAANIVAGLCLLLSGIGVVHFSYQNRQNVIELSELRADRDQLLQNWTYLMRDQNQLSEFSRIESTAMQSLSMHRPEKKDIYVMKKAVHSESKI